MRQQDRATTGRRPSGAPRPPRGAQPAGGGTWAVVLAAGEGSRLRALTTTSSGIAVPKQFCSLRGGASLLEEALQRAAAVAPMGTGMNSFVTVALAALIIRTLPSSPAAATNWPPVW